ncbi:MAG: SpoIIE family protein phosphatase [Bacteroidota bacterium]|nr:SpoIIE family protein phosphatase [Bacteroidota bacterium]
MSDKASINRLKLTKFKLNALLNITQAINDNLPADDLLIKAENILRKDLNIGKLVIFKKSGDWECILESGCLAGSCAGIHVEENLLPHSEITYITSSEKESLKGFDIIIPVYNNNAPIAFVIIGDIDEEGKGVSPVIKHLNFIQTLSNIVIVAIENIRLFEDSLKQEALKKELELASRMQSMLIPDNDTLPRNQYYQIAGFYLPHYEVGGDYYDCIQLNKHELGFCMADVSGKGISAALLMANFQASLRSLFTDEILLDDLARKLNRRIIETAHGEKFITIFIAKYNTRTQVLEYINAAHNAPVFYEMKSDRLMKFESSCVGIGMLDEIPSISMGSYRISENSKIICYTDGLSELTDNKGKEIGTIAIEKSIKNSKSISSNITSLIRNEKIKSGNSKLFDDVSILGLQFLV